MEGQNGGEQQDQSRSGRPESYVAPRHGPNGNPKHSRVGSTVAQSFADDLDSMFGLGMGGGGIDTLSQTVQEKKQTVTSGQTELEALEAKLRETEQRLAKVSRTSSPSRQADSGASAQQQPNTAKQAHPLAQKPTFPADRPPTSGSRPQAERENTQQMMAGMPGGMPGTPVQSGGGRDDYVMVDGSAR